MLQRFLSKSFQPSAHRSVFSLGLLSLLLVVEAIDAVGNTSRVEWPLEFSESKR